MVLYNREILQVTFSVNDIGFELTEPISIRN